jgi:hypothetical protein
MNDLRGKDMVDIRDVIDRIEELEDDDDLLEEEADELKDLKELAEECGNFWDDGTTLILDSYFKSYAQELAEDIGAISDFSSWPASCIDWDQAADELKQDYTQVTFGSFEYFVS